MKQKKYEHAVTIRVRYSETDKMGIVYNANYFDWFEIARTELCRAWGRPYTFWEEVGLMLPVVGTQCRYKRSVTYDELVQLWCRISEVKVYSVTFEYCLRRETDGKLIAEGWTKHGCVDRNGHLYKNEHPFYLWVKECAERQHVMS